MAVRLTSGVVLASPGRVGVVTLHEFPDPVISATRLVPDES
jgi:hypothetical protein